MCWANVVGFLATNDEIVVVDNQVPAARVYDMSGRYLRDLGAEGQGPGEAPTWDGRIPATKPAFVRLQVAATGEIWVVREKAAVSVPNCEPTHDGYGLPPRVSAAGIQPSGECFVWSYVADVFDSGGPYLGSANLPAMHPYMFVSGDIVLLRVEDEAGTVMVKRYRLVLPEEE